MRIWAKDFPHNVKINSKMIHIICIVSCHFRTYNVWPFSTTVSKNSDTMNLISFLLISFQTTIVLAISLWIFIFEFTMKSLWIYNLVRGFTTNSLSFSLINNEFTTNWWICYEFTMDLIPLSRYWYFANSLWIDLLFRDLL